MIHRVIPPLPREAKPRDPLVSSGTPHVLLSGSSALSLSGFSGPPSPQTLAETWWTQSNDMKACEYVTEVSLGVVFFGLVVVLPCAYVCLLVYRYIMIYMYIYIYICRWLFKIPLTANGQSSRIKKYFYESFAKPAFIFRVGLMLKSFAKFFAKTNNYFRKLRNKKLSRGLRLEPWRPL